MADSKKIVQVSLYYDVISPYAWFAFESLLRYENVWPIKVNLKPFSLGGIMQASGNRPPGEVHAKGLYMLKDIERNNVYWNMNLKAPKNFMKWIKTKTSDNAMKLLLVIQKEQPRLMVPTLHLVSRPIDSRCMNHPQRNDSELSLEKLETVSREFWKRIWTRGETIFEREDFEQVLLASGISNPAYYIDKMNDADIENELQKNTSDAINSGAFGAPWIVVHKDGEEHTFFGSDRLHLIAHLIGQQFQGGLTQFSKL